MYVEPNLSRGKPVSISNQSLLTTNDNVSHATIDLNGDAQHIGTASALIGYVLTNIGYLSLLDAFLFASFLHLDYL